MATEQRRKVPVYVGEQFERDVEDIARTRGVKVNQHLSEIVRDAVHAMAEAARKVMAKQAKEDRDGK